MRQMQVTDTSKDGCQAGVSSETKEGTIWTCQKTVEKVLKVLRQIRINDLWTSETVERAEANQDFNYISFWFEE